MSEKKDELKDLLEAVTHVYRYWNRDYLEDDVNLQPCDGYPDEACRLINEHLFHLCHSSYVSNRVQISVGLPRELFDKLEYHKLNCHSELIADEFQALAVAYLNRKIRSKLRLESLKDLFKQELVSGSQIYRFCKSRHGFADFLDFVIDAWPDSRFIGTAVLEMTDEERCRYEGVVQGLKARKEEKE